MVVFFHYYLRKRLCCTNNSLENKVLLHRKFLHFVTQLCLCKRETTEEFTAQIIDCYGIVEMYQRITGLYVHAY